MVTFWVEKKHKLCDLQKNYNDGASHIYANTTYKLRCYVCWHGWILLCICMLAWMYSFMYMCRNFWCHGIKSMVYGHLT